MNVTCEIGLIELEGTYTRSDGTPVMVDGVCATCSRCGHVTESFGTSDGSTKRCLVLMREECPYGENNYYTEGDQ